MSEPASNAQYKSSTLRIGLAGIGTVGSAVFKNLKLHFSKLAQNSGRKLEVTAISSRSRKKAITKGFDLQKIAWFDTAEKLAKSDKIDIFVELIGGADSPAYNGVITALKLGRPVVTANKALLAHHGAEIAQLAEETNTPIYYEAAIAGGIPIVKTLREALISNDITRVYGILNGTSNYILTKMEEDKISFDTCLKTAQELGYAEADPSFDIDGQDAAHKLVLLTSLAFGTKPTDKAPHIEGIRQITEDDIHAAAELGYRIKLLGIASQTTTGIEQSVQPVMFPITSPIAQISDVTNAVMIESKQLGEILLSGPGAGGDATASAVISDIVDIAKTFENTPFTSTFGLPVESSKRFIVSKEQVRKGGYFIRLDVKDRAGVFACIAETMAKNAISLKSIVQKAPTKKINKDLGNETKTIVMITHGTTDSAISKAISVLTQAEYVIGTPQKIRIEEKF